MSPTASPGNCWQSCAAIRIEKAKPDFSKVVARLVKELELAKGDVRVVLRAHKDLPVETIQAATVSLKQVEAQINTARSASKLDPIKLNSVGEVQAPSS